MLCTFSFLSSSVMINWSWLSWVIWLNFYSFLNQIQWFFLPQFCPFFMASRLKNINNRHNFVNFVNIVHFIHFVTILLMLIPPWGEGWVRWRGKASRNQQSTSGSRSGSGRQQSHRSPWKLFWRKQRNFEISPLSGPSRLLNFDFFLWNLTSLWTIPNFKF